MISYAQAREDIALNRALHHVHHDQGFYIDVGAYHPTIDSVTRHFYDHGWRGINVEPARELFQPFATDRIRDINIQAAVTDQAGSCTFYEVEGQLGTLEGVIADGHARAGITSRSYEVPAVTLTQICEKHAPRDIHFLKIDVEGHEGAALRGMDFVRFRPRILVVEATLPNQHEIHTHHQWEGIVMSAGYQLACVDLPNRYYVAQEHATLLPILATPVDQYVLASTEARIASLQARLDHAMMTINSLTSG